MNFLFGTFITSKCDLYLALYRLFNKKNHDIHLKVQVKHRKKESKTP